MHPFWRPARMPPRDPVTASWAFALCLACGASSPTTEAPAQPESRSSSNAPELEIVAESGRRWTGLAAAPGEDADRLFVAYPRWSDDVPVSVAELVDGAPVPFPDPRWNECWGAGDADPARCWVCVQSVFVDAVGDLWVLDAGNPRFAGVVEGAPKLVRFALSEDPHPAEPAEVISFAAPIVSPDSYLNDVRRDVERRALVLTDSGDGALVLVHADGTQRRVLDEHPSTHAEDITLTLGGVSFDREVHADGLAYDHESKTVFYQALRARTLYALSANALFDERLEGEALAARIEVVGETGASDGLLFGASEVLTTALEHDAIRAIDPRTGEVRDVIRDPRIAWPDSIARGWTDLYFTTAQIHLGASPRDPFRVWRLRRSPTRALAH